MSLTTIRDRPAYVGLLAASTVCIVLLAASLVAALLEVPFAVINSPAILAALAAIFAAVALAVSDSSDSTGEGSVTGTGDSDRTEPDGRTR